jgi:hypothetical protein
MIAGAGETIKTEPNRYTTKILPSLSMMKAKPMSKEV